MYLPNTECLWVIFASDNTKLVLKFSDFNLEYSDGCTKDYVRVINGHLAESPIFGQYCGRDAAFIPPAEGIESLSNSISILFVSDDMVEDTGFAFSWDATLEGCGGEVTGKS